MSLSKFRRRRQRAGKDVNDVDNDMHEVGEEDNRLTIFDSSGVAVQDCVIACMVYEALQQQVYNFSGCESSLQPF